MLQTCNLQMAAVLILAAFPKWVPVTAQVDDKSTVEATVRAMEDAVQAYDFTSQDSLLASGARWIERSRPERAAFDGTGFFVEAKAAKVILTNRRHDFDIHVQGDVAWGTLLLDVTTIASNETVRALLARTESEETGKPSPPDQREWRATYLEREVLVRTPRGWKIVLAHTLRLPEKGE